MLRVREKVFMAGSSSSELHGLEAWLRGALGDSPSFKGITYYEEYRAVLGDLTRFRNIVELGVAEGASLLAWAHLAPLAVCTGFDVEPPVKLQQSIAALGLTDRVRVFRADQSDPTSIGARIGTPDLIVDDASHLLKETRTCFRHLFPFLAPGGWYCIEDWAAGYWETFGGTEKGAHRLLYEIIDEIAMEDRIKPQAEGTRVSRRAALPIRQMIVRGIEPIAYLQKADREFGKGTVFEQ